MVAKSYYNERHKQNSHITVSLACLLGKLKVLDGVNYHKQLGHTVNHGSEVSNFSRDLSKYWRRR